MKKSFRQSMAWLHTWAGLLLGWLLVAIFITGTSAYFREEITLWMQPELHDSTLQPDTVDKALAALNAKAPDARSWDISLPGPRHTAAELRWQPAKQPENEGRRRGEQMLMDADSGEIVSPRATRGGNFLYRFHFELYGIDRLWARLLVCLATLFMLIAIISGVITHKKIFKDFFTFRPGKGQRSWLDAHNATAVLALPYHFMITYSGLLLFMTLIMPWGIDAAYQGDRRAFFSEVFSRGEDAARPGAPEAMVAIGPLIEQTETRFGKPVTRIQISNPNRDNVQITLRVNRDPAVTDRQRGGDPTQVFLGNTGELIDTHIPANDPVSPGWRIYNFFTSVHMARFADPLTRWLFFLFGVAGCAMTITGMLLWVSKRTQQLRRDQQPDRALKMVNGLNMASITGLMLAIAAYFLANRLLPVTLEARESREIQVFFLAWLVSLVHGLLRPHRQGWVEQVGATTVLWFAVPIINMLTTESHLFSALAWQHPAIASFDLVCLILAGLGGYTLWRLQRKPVPAKPRRARPPRAANTSTTGQTPAGETQ